MRVKTCGQPYFSSRKWPFSTWSALICRLNDRLSCQVHCHQYLGKIQQLQFQLQSTLKKFWRYNKAIFGELVPLEILEKHQQGLTQGIRQWYISECTHTEEPHPVDTSPMWTPCSCGHFCQGPLSFPFIVVDFHNTKWCKRVIQNTLCYTEKSPTGKKVTYGGRAKIGNAKIVVLTFSISALPPGFAFKIWLNFLHLWTIFQKKGRSDFWQLVY